MDITPSPRILSMLGEIEFDEWQCIAELVDNSFDDFSSILSETQAWPGGFKVSVTLPSPTADLAGAEVVVRDTGRGMTSEILEQAVKAGWSNNDRFDKLGLFGMGFNVSTARLGRQTRVLTTRAGDPEWIGVEIDLDHVGSDFRAPDITEPKDDPSEHGTRIIVSGLHRERAEWLQRNAVGLRTKLGSVYGWMLEHRPFELWIQGTKVLPRRLCRWGDDRYVIYGSGANAERIPAYIPIDQRFELADACDICGNWQERGKNVCDQCGSDRLRQRERRLHGWLGIQRHLDRREFGIDFLRNGRKILIADKRLFDWKNPNDPAGGVDTEYPIEMAHQGGRIIGEIHLDYVPVHYDKTAFEYSDRGWRAAVDYLRGTGPLQPKKAEAQGFPANTSPLALLFKGFRRNDAGIRCLIPGDGKRPLHEETRQWAMRFWAGDPDYQTDERWWSQVQEHERKAQADKLQNATQGTSLTVDDVTVMTALGVSPTPVCDDSDRGDGSTQAPPPSQPETVQERIDRYTREGTPLPALSREYGLSSLGVYLKVTTIEIAHEIVDGNGMTTPVWLAQASGGQATAFIDACHDAITKQGLEAADLLLMELAAHFKVLSNSAVPLSQIMSQLRATCLPDMSLDATVVRAQASELVGEIRQRMATAVANDPPRALSFLDPDEQTRTENEMVAAGADSLTATLDDGGEFVTYAPPLYLVKLLEGWPEAFMEGIVFVGPYLSLTSQSSRRLSLARIVGYLNDVATLLEFQKPAPDQLRRTRLSIQLLQHELAPEAG